MMVMEPKDKLTADTIANTAKSEVEILIAAKLLNKSRRTILNRRGMTGFEIERCTGRHDLFPKLVAARPVLKIKLIPQLT